MPEIGVGLVYAKTAIRLRWSEASKERKGDRGKRYAGVGSGEVLQGQGFEFYFNYHGKLLEDFVQRGGVTFWVLCGEC